MIYLIISFACGFCVAWLLAYFLKRKKIQELPGAIAYDPKDKSMYLGIDRDYIDIIPKLDAVTLEIINLKD